MVISSTRLYLGLGGLILQKTEERDAVLYVSKTTVDFPVIVAGVAIYQLNSLGLGTLDAVK